MGIENVWYKAGNVVLLRKINYGTCTFCSKSLRSAETPASAVLKPGLCYTSIFRPTASYTIPNWHP